MIKIFSCMCVLVVAMYACSNSATSNEKKDTVAAEAPAANVSPDYEKGLALIAQSDCLTCHKVDEKITGPAYREVANKYPNTPETIDSLAVKIIKGGQGVWGSVPMTPHPAISPDDAKQMVKYIMLLKNN